MKSKDWTIIAGVYASMFIQGNHCEVELLWLEQGMCMLLQLCVTVYAYCL